jgi:hypothetical protein
MPKVVDRLNLLVLEKPTAANGSVQRRIMSRPDARTYKVGDDVGSIKYAGFVGTGFRKLHETSS